MQKKPISRSLPLAGQVAVVTGGSGGIGAAIVRLMAQSGATVISADLRIVDTSPTSNIRYAELDVTSVKSIESVFAQTALEFGRIDILVNVAGIISQGPAASITESQWDQVMDVNLKGTFFCCQTVAPLMKRQKYGRIINLGSVLGKNGGNPRPWLEPKEQDKAGSVAYGVTKAGVHAMTAYLAKEFAAFGITVNSIAPGPIASSMTQEFPASLKALVPVGRMGTAEEVAEAALFLASPLSSFITGETLDINGGLWND